MAIRQAPTPSTSDASCDLSRLLATRLLARELNLFGRRPAKALMQGESRSRMRGRGMEFEEARVYAAGDDVRSIDWRVTARTGVAHTKVFREERERPVHILVDQRSNMYFGSRGLFKSVFAAETAAAIAWAALAHSDRIGGQIVGDGAETDIRARRSRHAVLQFIRQLHLFNQRLPGSGDAIDFASALTECHRLVRPGSAVYILSDFFDFDEGARKSLTLMGRHADLTLIRVLDPLEREVPAVGRTRIGNGTEESDVLLDTLTARRLTAHLAHLDTQIQDSCRQARATLIRACCVADTPASLLRRYYGQ